MSTFPFTHGLGEIADSCGLAGLPIDAALYGQRGGPGIAGSLANGSVLPNLSLTAMSATYGHSTAVSWWSGRRFLSVHVGDS